MTNSKEKYLKYKLKYLNLKKIKSDQIGGKKYKESLSEPWFSLIKLGLKTVEGRKNKRIFKEMRVNDIIEWTNNNFAPRKILTRITQKIEYDTFREYLESEGLNKCLPGMTNIEDGLSVYFKYYTKEDEKQYGVIAIRMELIT